MGGQRKKREAPESWTGQRVSAALGFGGGPYLGTLEEVNSRGIVLRYEMEDGEGRMFVPWRHVDWIYPLDEPRT